MATRKRKLYLGTTEKVPERTRRRYRKTRLRKATNRSTDTLIATSSPGECHLSQSDFQPASMVEDDDDLLAFSQFGESWNDADQQSESDTVFVMDEVSAYSSLGDDDEEQPLSLQLEAELELYASDEDTDVLDAEWLQFSAQEDANTLQSVTHLDKVDDKYFEPLYEGATISIFDSYLFQLQFALRHSLTQKAFKELLELVSLHLPRPNKAPLSVYQLKKFFLNIFSCAKFTPHRYCSSCQHLLSSQEAVCPNSCLHSRVEEFILLDLESQLKEKLSGK